MKMREDNEDFIEVELLRDSAIKPLQEQINNFLYDLPAERLVDIKLSETEDTLSALIIYRYNWGD